MPEQKSSILTKPISRTRKNHALEHATLNLLHQQGYGKLSGWSYPGGFWVLGKVPTETLLKAANDALLRLQQGNVQLAIHSQCGTNYVASGMVAGTAAWLTMQGSNREDNWERLPLVIAVSTLAFILSRPLGPWLQHNVTTQPNVGNTMKVIEITFYERRGPGLHRVKTKG